LAARVKRQAEIDAGASPDFPTETAEIRAKSWTVAPIPRDLEDRRVKTAFRRWPWGWNRRNPES
jgi:malate synthase